MSTFSYSKELQNSIYVSQAIAKENMNSKVYPPHLLLGLLHQESGIRELLHENDIDIFYLEEWAHVKIESCPKSSDQSQAVELDQSIETILEEAVGMRISDTDELQVADVLISLSTPGVGLSFDELKTFSTTADELKSILNSTVSNGDVKSNTSTPKKLNYLNDLRTVTSDENWIPIVARDQDILKLIETIGRHKKPHVIITGESGVGKTVLTEGLAKILVLKKASMIVNESPIFKLDVNAIISGITYKGELEDRLRKVFKAISTLNRPILVIDDIQILLDEQIGGKGIAYLLKSELSNSNIVLISTASNDSFRKLIDKNAILMSLFENFKLDKPNANQAAEILKAHIKSIEEHHRLSIDSETITEAIRMASRHLNEQYLPSSAIDLVDRTMSSIRAILDALPTEIESLRNRLAEKDCNTTAIKNELAKQLTFIGLESNQENESAEVVCEQMLEQLDSYLETRKETADIHDIAATIGRIKGIPAGKILSKERDRLLGMEDALQENVIGQNSAITTLCNAILESRSGLNKPGLPIGSFFLLGPTGTGKTELAKQLAQYLFQSSDSLIRFDMSEFKEEHSAALLYGAPPGYVGYEEGGMLVNKIRQKPYSVVLFDEIEKAHPSVFDIFLQILDEGKLNDRLGKTGDFSNAVILFTSNIGSQSIVNQFNSEKTLPESSSLMEHMASHFRPEFLGRLTGLVPFAPITLETITRIFDIQINELANLLQQQELDINITNEAKVFLAEKGFTPEYGARPLRGVIRSELKTPLSRKIISGELSKGKVVNIELNTSKKQVDINITEAAFKEEEKEVSPA